MDEVEVDVFAALLVNKMPMLLLLAKHGFFDMRGGSMAVNFRENGTIAKIERHEYFSVS